MPTCTPATAEDARAGPTVIASRVTRALPSLETKSNPPCDSPSRLLTRELTSAGRALARRSPSPEHCLPTQLPTTAAGGTDAARACGSSGAPPAPDRRSRASEDRPPIPSTGPARKDGPRTAISFTSPKLTRKPPPPEPLPRPPYVTTTRNREALQVIQAGLPASPTGLN